MIWIEKKNNPVIWSRTNSIASLVSSLCTSPSPLSGQLTEKIHTTLLCLNKCLYSEQGDALFFRSEDVLVTQFCLFLHQSCIKCLLSLNPLQWIIFPVYLIGCTSMCAGDVSLTSETMSISVCWTSVQRVIERNADQLSMLKESGLSQMVLVWHRKAHSLSK